MRLPLLLSLLLATPAVAQAVPAHADLAESLGDRDQRVVAGGVVWRCTGSGCTGGVPGGRFADTRACRDLAGRVGRVAAFTGAGGVMTTEALADCNRRAH